MDRRIIRHTLQQPLGPGEQKHLGGPFSELNTNNEDAKRPFPLPPPPQAVLSTPVTQHLSRFCRETALGVTASQPPLACDASVFMPCPPFILNLRSLCILKPSGHSCPGNKKPYSHLRNNRLLGLLDFSSVTEYCQI